MAGKRSGFFAIVRGLLLPAAAAAVLLCFAAALNGLSEGRNGEDLRQLERVLRRSCSAYYAAEGVYPSSLEELEERYGLQVDWARFTVRYRAFAENLMPDITVLENKP